jgi:hypothetical protein
MQLFVSTVYYKRPKKKTCHPKKESATTRSPSAMEKARRAVTGSQATPHHTKQQIETTATTTQTGTSSLDIPRLKANARR